MKLRELYGIPLTFLQFSREFEAQADYLGVEYMYRAGYDPSGVCDLLREDPEPGEAEAGNGCEGILVASADPRPD